MFSSKNHSSCTQLTCGFKVNTSSSAWYKSMTNILKNINGGEFALDVEEGMAYVTGQGDPNKLLKLMGSRKSEATQMAFVKSGRHHHQHHHHPHDYPNHYHNNNYDPHYDQSSSNNSYYWPRGNGYSQHNLPYYPQAQAMQPYYPHAQAMQPYYPHAQAMQPYHPHYAYPGYQNYGYY